MFYFHSQISKAGTEIPSEIDRAVSVAENTSRQINQLEGKVASLCHDISDHNHSIKPMVGEFSSLVEKIHELEKYAHYLSTVAKIEDIR